VDIAGTAASIKRSALQATASSPLRSVRSFFRLLIEKLCRSLTFTSLNECTQRQANGDEEEFVWLEVYKAALMEFNEQRLSANIGAAMKAIERRRQALGSDRMSIQERNLLEHAALTLWSIRASRSSPISITSRQKDGR
jgi:hypothetical protein